jgi:translation initiation factor IF-2
MSEKKSIRLNKLTKELNVGSDRILSFLQGKGVAGLNPTSKISDDIYQLLLKQFQSSKQTKLAAKIVANKLSMEQESQELEAEKVKTQVPTLGVKPIGIIDLPDSKTKKVKTTKKTGEPKKEEVIKAKAQLLSKPKVMGEKVDLEKLSFCLYYFFFFRLSCFFCF